MTSLTLADVAEGAGGRLSGGADPAALVESFGTDSRAVTPGSVFVAVVGEHHDAHDFARSAIAAGAVAVLSDRDLDVPCVVVDDSVLGLGRLARWVVDACDDLLVIAVTGSSGKTSTKDLLAQVLVELGPVVAPQGSFNTEVGVPLTALTLTDQTRVLVSEMGARGAGHVAYLCGITPPRIGIVLNVGSAHVSEFGSREAIAQAKGELIESLPEDGLAVLNADDPLVLEMASRTRATTVTYGRSAHADVRALDEVVDDEGRVSFLLATAQGSASVSLRLHGTHHVSNALAVAAAAVGAGMSVDAVARRLSDAVPVSKWRMEVTTTSAGVTVINDAYNANPESVLAALDALVSMSRATQTRTARRTWAVLGEMRELGDSSPDAHLQIGRDAASRGIDHVLAVGAGAYGVATGAAEVGGGTVVLAESDVDEAVSVLRAGLRPGDVVLVKASRASGLERVALALTEEQA